MGNRSYGLNFYRKVTKSFKFLPMCAIVNDKIFCVQEGVTSLIKSRQDLMDVEKVASKRWLFRIENVSTEFLWNDPDPKVRKYGTNNRLLGRSFGKRICDEFRNNLQFDVVIRGHQMVMDGYNWPFGENGGLLTIFSSPNYCEDKNGSAIAVVKIDQTIEVEQMEPNHGQNKQDNC